MSKERGTFLIEFTQGGSVVCGNNYKPWWEHARELIYRSQGNRDAIQEHGWQYKYVADAVKSVKYSNQPFYDDGGLKWCDINSYQEIIDKVCKKQQLAPVKLADIVFNDTPQHKATLTKKLKEY